MDKKIIGICGAGDMAKIKEAGIEWIRMPALFPWTDKLYGTLKDKYIEYREIMKDAKAHGIKVAAISPLIGMYLFDDEKKCALWKDAWPQNIMGYSYGDDQFYKIIEEVCAWIAKDLDGIVDDVWQISNEMDSPTFRGPYKLEVAKKLSWASAKGIRSIRPDALCGINPAHLTDYARELFRMCYAEGTPLNIAGIDGYYGSWAPGSVEAWDATINEIHEITGCKVIVFEWGYSSIGKVTPPPEKDIVINGVGSVCTTKSWHNSWKSESEHTEEIQAEYVTRGLEIIQNNPNALGGFLFSWKDDLLCYHCGQPDCPSECGWGVIRHDLTPKPVFYAIQKASKELY